MKKVNLKTKSNLLMFRVSALFHLLIILSSFSYGQRVPSPVGLKNGLLSQENSLLKRKINHPLWQSSRFGSEYYVIVQLSRSADQFLKNTLAGRGIFIKQWISSNNYLAICRAGFSLSGAVTEIQNVYSIPPVLKLNPGITNHSYNLKGPKDLLVITCFDGNKRVIEETLRSSGLTIVDTKVRIANTWFVKAAFPAIEKLSLLPFISSISPIHLEDVPLNYNNRAIHGVQSLSSTAGRNLTGKNLIIGIGDNADPSAHIDLAGKLIMRTDEPVDFHGTHTSGTIAGGGIADPMYSGMAPRAHLVVNDFSNILINSPAYVSDYQMPITNNSYYSGVAGCAGEGEYNVLSYYVDSQLLALPKLMHVFAAGNDGGLTCAPFPTSFGTIKSGFQTSKNGLIVGALNTVNYDPGGSSSRGPTLDGRIKPDVVAGGVYITSTIPGNLYAMSTGTSMASPTVAGILALITERYRQLHFGDFPEAALLKAVITNTATDLGNPGPDYSYGFGMVNARGAVEALEQNHYLSATVADQATQILTLPGIPAGLTQLKIMLYWPDQPAMPLAPVSLVNDLDLLVTEPSGTIHQPLVLNPGATGVNTNAAEGPDHINNAEQVVINNPSGGSYQLTVKGFAVPAGPQKFFITYETFSPSVKLDYPFGSETWVPGQTETIRWTPHGSSANSFTLEFSGDGGSSWTIISNTIPALAVSWPFTVPEIFSNKALIRITRNGDGYTDQNIYPFTILHQPALTVTNTCPGYVQLIWGKVPGADKYEVMKFAGDTMQVISQTTDTNYLAAALVKNDNYWFSVRPVFGGVFGRRSTGQHIIPGGGACVATSLNNDLLIDSIVAPRSGRQYTSSQLGNERIGVHVSNPGALPSSAPFDISFQINGGVVVTEVFSGSIAAHGDLHYFFSVANNYDFSSPGKYLMKAWIHSSADTIPLNDTVTQSLKCLRNDALVLSPSFAEGFENAADKNYQKPTFGLDSLDRVDFSNATTNGRLNTFYNTGFARTGKRSMLLDVSESGSSSADSMTITFNLSNYSLSDQIWLDFYLKKQSLVAPLPGNQIFIRGNDQANWIAVRNLSDPADAPGQYIKVNLDVTGILASAFPSQTISSSFQVRCGYEGSTPATSSDPSGLLGGGIDFDDFLITKSTQDIGVGGLIQPVLKNLCDLGKTEKISVLIKNFGIDTARNIPVTYAINNDTVTEIVPILAPKDSLIYSFSQTADMSEFQPYHLKIWTSNLSDNYRNNDSSANYLFQTSPLITTYPYLEGFESNNGYWFSSGQNNSWQWGKPGKTIIHKAANGQHAWVTSLNGNYDDNEHSFLYSPCFDLTTLAQPVFSFSHIFRTEDDCYCDFHWVEYSIDDSSWKVLGNTTTGVNWYDNTSMKAWQHSSPRWHVSSYDVPVSPSKIRFRIVMSSDPGSNFEGVGVDDVHVFDKAPVFTDSATASLTLPVNGSDWIHYDKNGQRIFSINANGQDLGNTSVSVFRHAGAIRDTAGQYYGNRNWVVQPARPAATAVSVRYYFTAAEADELTMAAGCDSCLDPEDPYTTGVTQYHSPLILEEDSSLANNQAGEYLFHGGGQVKIIPYDNGYYAETSIKNFSEFWLNAGMASGDHPLAAWLNTFSAVRMDATGLLDWTSWQEKNSLKYLVQKSSDSLRFNTIAELAAIPHPDSVRSYHFTDPQLFSGPNYYRLILVNLTADSLVSPVEKLTFSKDSVVSVPDSIVLGVYPNPTSGDLTINSSSICNKIEIFDVLGRKKLERSCQGFAQHLSIGYFAPGFYFLKLFTANGEKLIKLQKR